MITVLYVTHEHDIMLGSTRSLLNMISAVRHIINPIVLLPKKGCVTDALEKSGIRYIIANFPSGITDKKGAKFAMIYIPRIIRDSIRIRRAFSEIENQLGETRVDIVHTNSAVIDFGYRYASKYGIPHVWHLREFIDLFFGFKPFMGWKKFHEMLNSSTATISISIAVRNHYRGTNLKDSDYVLYDAVRKSDECRFDAKKNRYFMVCGAITQSKGIETAIEAFRLFKAQNSAYRLLLIGNVEPAYKKRLDTLTASAGMQNSVEFVPYTDDIESYFVKASGLLMCSPNEGLGRVTVEAMFYGCPVIGYRSGATKEIITDNVTGYLFDTPQQCADAMNRVIDKECMIRLTANAQSKAKESFTEESFKKQIIDQVYNRIVQLSSKDK